MPFPRMTTRRWMIAVAVVGMECAFAAYAIGELLRKFGPDLDALDSSRWVLQLVLLCNALATVPALILWYLWRFISRLFRACDEATRRPDMSRRFRAL